LISIGSLVDRSDVTSRDEDEDNLGIRETVAR